MAGAPFVAGPAQYVGQVGAVAEQPARARRDGGPHPIRARVAGERRAQGHHHLLGGGEDLPLSCRGAGHAQREQGGAEPVVGQRGPGDADGPTGQPGGLYGASAGVAQGGAEQDLPARGEPFADDPQCGFGLDGEVEADGSGRAVDGAADAESAPPLAVGQGPVGDPGPRVGERLLQGGPGSEPGQGLVRGEDLGLAAAAGPGEVRHEPEREDGRAVRPEGGEPQLGDGGPVVYDGPCGIGRRAGRHGVVGRGGGRGIG